MILGIDPGFSGGLAVISPKGNLVAGIRMPVTHIRKRELIDIPQLQRFVSPYIGTLDCAVLEEVHSMPAQGVASTFKFGRAAGAVEAWALSLFGNDETHFVSPRKWKRDMNLTHDKRASLHLCEKLWPEPPAHIKWNILRNDGIAEAALIAEHFRTF